MKTSIQLFPLVALLVVGTNSTALAATQQTAGNVFNSRPYLYVEAESYSTLNDADNNGWKIVSKESPITSPQGKSILPATSNVSGTAIINDIGGFTSQASLADTATYEVRFVTAGTYQLYTRHTLFDSAPEPGNFGNEDSLFMSPGFNKNSSTDWVDFQGLAYDQTAVGDPNPNDGIDPAGFVPATSDSPNNGWFALRDWGVKSAGVVTNDNDANGDFWNGHFYWYSRPFYVAANSSGGFVEDFGFKTQFIVTPDMLNQTLTFEVGAREDYGVIDGFLFIQDDSLNLLDQFTQEQVDAVLTPPAAGDADFDGDGDVDGADFLALQRSLGAATGATHAMGDANNDQAVNAADLAIFQTQFGGGGSAQAIPEPAALGLALLSCLGGMRLRRRREIN
jgi:hypothetical protein